MADPTAIPKAILIALAVVLILYAAVGAALLSALGAEGLAAARDPVARAAAAGPWPWLVPVVRASAGVAAAGSLMALLLGVSRTVLAMARDRHLPACLAAVHPDFRVPHHAEIAVAGVVIATLVLADLRGAIGFSSFAVLLYYVVANASAWTLEGGRKRVVPAAGLIGCLVLAGTLPASSRLAGMMVAAAGAALWFVRKKRIRPSH